MMHTLEPYLTGKDHVIWDWNGTLVDDVEVCVAMLAGQLKARKLPPVSLQIHRENFGFPISEYYRRLGFIYSGDEYSLASKNFVEELNERIQTCQLFEGTMELIGKLKSRGVRQSVLSATHQGLLEAQVKHFGLSGYFDGVYGLSDHSAGSKLQRGEELISDSGVSPEKTILVGDTDHDLEVGHKLGLEVVLVAEGHQSYRRLTEKHPCVVRLRKVTTLENRF